jgi:hypothetical protein
LSKHISIGKISLDKHELSNLNLVFIENKDFRDKHFKVFNQGDEKQDWLIPVSRLL